MAVETTARPSDSPKAVPDVIHVIARHERGALSSVVASWEIQAYRRPGLELYGTEGTANLLGDDWDPGGYRIFRAAEGAWREVASPDPTWLWTDGLRELVSAIHEGRPPLGSIDQDIHLVEVLAAARRSAAARAPVAVGSRFEPMDLGLELRPAHLHDHTRSPDEQR
jgi:predicted dehydrogenase